MLGKAIRKLLLRMSHYEENCFMLMQQTKGSSRLITNLKTSHNVSSLFEVSLRTGSQHLLRRHSEEVSHHTMLIEDEEGCEPPPFDDVIARDDSSLLSRTTWTAVSTIGTKRSPILRTTIVLST